MKVVSMVIRYHFQQKGSDNFQRKMKRRILVMTNQSHDKTLPRHIYLGNSLFI